MLLSLCSTTKPLGKLSLSKSLGRLPSHVRNCVGPSKSSVLEAAVVVANTFESISKEENRIIFQRGKMRYLSAWMVELWMLMWSHVWISVYSPTLKQFQWLNSISPQFSQESLELYFINFNGKPEINWDLRLILLLLFFYLSLMIHRFVLTVVVL